MQVAMVVVDGYESGNRKTDLMTLD